MSAPCLGFLRVPHLHGNSIACDSNHPTYEGIAASNSAAAGLACMLPRREQHEGARTDQHEGAHTDQHEGANTDQHEGAHTDQHEGAHTDQHKGAHTDQHEGAHTDQHEGAHTDQHESITFSCEAESQVRLCTVPLIPSSFFTSTLRSIAMYQPAQRHACICCVSSVPITSA
eukprot:360908-Chlamydomonas_euryale.AAC.11